MPDWDAPVTWGHYYLSALVGLGLTLVALLVFYACEGVKRRRKGRGK